MIDRTVLEFLAAPFVASLILTGIHAYLGVHVVERGVIFVDLSLAQIAALGATTALLLPITGGDAHSPIAYWVSLGFTFLGAFVFSTIRSRRARIPQEAIIGICYAVASAAAMLYSDTIGKRLAIGWTMGTVVSAVGVYLSLHLDLPTGATIVCTFGLALILMALVRPLIQRSAPKDIHQVGYADRVHGS